MRRMMRERLPAIIRIAQILHVRGSLYDSDLQCVLTAELGGACSRPSVSFLPQKCTSV